MSFKKYCLGKFFLTVNYLFLSTSGFAQFCYAKTIATSSVNFSIINADLNKDGFEDLASVDMDTLVSILLGDGKGNFTTTGQFNIGAMAMGMSVITQDFNNDGKLDLAVADMMNMSVSVLLGNGNGTFGTPASFPVAPTPYMLVSADFNKDGKLDIATANNYSSKNVSLLLGNGNGTFADSVNFFVSSSLGTSSIATADFNKDGKPDLVVGNSDTNYVSVMLGNGLGSFASASNLVVGVYLSSWPQSVNCTDLNKDGNVDIVSANGGDNTVTVLSGRGNGTFASDTSFSVSPSGHQNNFPQSVIAADFNGDGKIDLATANLNSYDVSLLLGNGAGGFNAVASFAASVDPYVLISSDFNKDTAIDIAVANADANKISILLNCPAGKADTIIKIDTVFTGITALNQSNGNSLINIYPDPSNGKFQIAVNNSDLTKNFELEIYNIQGEKVFYLLTKQLNNSPIDISDQPSGIYVLRLKYENGITIKKIIIQK